MSDQSDLCTCCTCGYQWQRGKSGSHYCSDYMAKTIADQAAEIERLKQRLLSAAGDDLCRLTPEEIKAYSNGSVKIPPEEEFIPSCRQFWKQTADRTGVLQNCLTLAQLVAENQKLLNAISQLQEVKKKLAVEAKAIEDKYNASGYHGDLDCDELEAETIWKCVREINGVLHNGGFSL